MYKKDYPRPQLVRRDWENLNGEWDFAFDDGNLGEKEGWTEQIPKQMKIRVPFTYETAMSGIGETKRHDVVWYERQLILHPEEGKRLLLHFEGSDFLTKVWLNGCFLGQHRGGYARFTFDLTEAAREGENSLVVKAEDSFSTEQPRGKQRWADSNFACWYVQTTGIWKTVWTETVPAVRVEALKLTPMLEEVQIRVEARLEGRVKEGMELESMVSFQGKPISRSVCQVSSELVREEISVLRMDESPLGVHLWSPKSPQLYDMTIRLRQDGEIIDEVSSYFGMRQIRIEQGSVLLNGEPLYQRLILDQGYWPESHLTPPDEEALIADIDRIHELGFNGLRKHMKIEDERFLYWCDVKGMLVWSEMAACYLFSDQAVEEFTREWMAVVRQNYSHPCIITWTPFNESWGIPMVKTSRPQQHFTEAIYHLTKAFDPMRPVVVNDGWEHTVSDIITLHDYEERGEDFLERYLDHKEEILSGEIYHSRCRSAMALGYAYRGQPVIISEYGGIAFCQKGSGEWGYGSGARDGESFLCRYDSITSAIRQVPYIAGYCYTQVSDVQQEVNGLMTAEREFKVDPQRIAEINRRKTALQTD